MRLAREHKYRLLLKFVQRLYQAGRAEGWAAGESFSARLVGAAHANGPGRGARRGRGGVLALGVLRGALLAHGTPASDLPVLRLLTYGGVFTVTAALIFVPAYTAWQERVFELRDALHPIPEDGRPAPEWFVARDSFDTLLAARVSAGRVLTATFGVLAPLAGSVVSALLSGSN